MTVIIGADPGKAGGFCVLRMDGEIIDLFTMPVVGKEIDCQALLEKLWYPEAHAFLERAQALPGNGAVSMFNYGKGFGYLEMLCAAREWSTRLIRPTQWQKEMFEGTSAKAKPKERALLSAQRLFPKAPLIPEGCRKAHDGLVDALLLAEWGRRQLGLGDPAKTDNETMRKLQAS